MKRAIGGLVLLVAAASASLGAGQSGVGAAAQGHALRVAVKPIAYDAFQAYVTREAGRWGEVIRKAGAEVD